MNAITDFLLGIARLTLALILVVLGLAFFLGLLVVGLFATAVWSVWCLVTGRRPTIVRFGSLHQTSQGMWSRFQQRAGPAPRTPPPGSPREQPRDAIDVEARDVPER